MLHLRTFIHLPLKKKNTTTKRETLSKNEMSLVFSQCVHISRCIRLIRCTNIVRAFHIFTSSFFKSFCWVFCFFFFLWLPVSVSWNCFWYSSLPTSNCIENVEVLPQRSERKANENTSNWNAHENLNDFKCEQGKTKRKIEVDDIMLTIENARIFLVSLCSPTKKRTKSENKTHCYSEGVSLYKIKNVMEVTGKMRNKKNAEIETGNKTAT